MVWLLGMTFFNSAERSFVQFSEIVNPSAIMRHWYWFGQYRVVRISDPKESKGIGNGYV